MSCFDEVQHVFTSGEVRIGVADAATPIREVSASGTAVHAEGLKLLTQARGPDFQTRAGTRRTRPGDQRHTRQEFTPCHGLLLDARNSTTGAVLGNIDRE